MGKYDDITHEQLRDDLVRFAELILRLDREDGLLASPADLQTLLGELRQKLFAWEIRASRRLQAGAESEGSAGTEPREGAAAAQGAPDDHQVRESLRIVRDALQREEELLQEWEEGPPPDEESDEAS